MLFYSSFVFSWMALVNIVFCWFWNCGYRLFAVVPSAHGLTLGSSGIVQPLLRSFSTTISKQDRLFSYRLTCTLSLVPSPLSRLRKVSRQVNFWVLFSEAFPTLIHTFRSLLNAKPYIFWFGVPMHINNITTLISWYNFFFEWFCWFIVSVLTCLLGLSSSSVSASCAFLSSNSGSFLPVFFSSMHWNSNKMPYIF